AMSGTAFAQAQAPRHRAARHPVAAPVAATPAPPHATIVTTPMAPVTPAGPQQSLREALVKTYAGNPTLMAQRQSLRATDESVDIARAAGRPQASATAGYDQDAVTNNLGSNGRAFTATANASMPL